MKVENWQKELAKGREPDYACVYRTEEDEPASVDFETFNRDTCAWTMARSFMFPTYTAARRYLEAKMFYPLE